MPHGAQLRVWSEPVDGESRAYRATARLRDSNQNLIWDDEVFTESDQSNPIVIELQGAETFWGSMRITFASVIKSKLYNEVWTQKGGKWVRHGDRKICTFSPAGAGSVLEAFVYIKMQKEDS